MIAKTLSSFGSLTALALAALLAVPGAAQAQDEPAQNTSVRVTGDIQVDGRATVGSWDCQVAEFDSEVELAEDLDGLGGLTFQDLGDAVTGLTMSVSAAMDCDDGDDMDEYSREALEVEDHPTVDFEMNGYEVVETQGNEAEVELRGIMTISGDDRPVTIPATVAPEDNGLAVSGSFELDMTEYDVDPPRMMLGTIRVRSDVEISFDLFVEEA